MIHVTSLDDARRLIAAGRVLAYPTEAVYGLGCDPFNQHAVDRVLALKQRLVTKGLILLIHDWEQLASLISTVPEARLDAVRATWPGPITWVFPKAKIIPDWLTGAHDSIAVRMSEHPVARALCLEGPVVSTSANITGHPPARDNQMLRAQFPEGIDAVVAGEVGTALLPSMMFDVLSGVRLR